MPRTIDLRLKPSDHDAGLEISAYTYSYDTQLASHSMRESVYMDVEVGPARVYACMTPAEARTLAQHLLRVAEVADEHRQRRESLDEIEEQLSDPDFDPRVVHICHPDVVYADAGEMEAVAARNPGKVVISRCEQGGIGLANNAAAARGVAA